MLSREPFSPLQLVSILSLLFVSSLLLLSLTAAYSTPCWAQSDTMPRTLSELQQEAINANRVPVKNGDVCIVCGAELRSQDVVLMVRGRRVPVRKEWLEEFQNNPEQYFYSLQPRAALFSENAKRNNAGWGWFSSGTIILITLLITGLAAIKLVASQAGGSLPPGLAKIPDTAEPLPCPNCKSENHPSAGFCSSCGTELSPEIKSEVLQTL